MLSSKKNRLRHGTYLRQVHMVPGQEKCLAHAVYGAMHARFWGFAVATKAHMPQYLRSLVVSSLEGSADSVGLSAYAIRTLKHMYRPGDEYKKALVILGSCSPTVSVKPVSGLTGNVRQVDEGLDEVNARFGRGVVWLGALGTKLG